MRSLVRVPIFFLDYSTEKDKALARELLVDYDNKKIYAKSKDGLTFIGFNEVADAHIANADLHVTKAQKDWWTGSINSINTALGTKAPLESPAFTGTPTALTAATADNSTLLATTAFVKAAMAAGDVHSVDGKHVDDTQNTIEYLWTAAKIKAYVDSLLASNDAMVFKATIGAGGGVTILPTTDYQAGWSYKVVSPGTHAGNVCQVGDLIICIKDYAEGTASNADWTVVQTNIDGAVTSSSTSVTNGHVPIFDGTTGKIIKTSNKALPSGSIIGNTDYGTTGSGGVVRSSSSTNQVSIDPNGLMTVNLISATKGGTGKNSIAVDAMLYASAANTYSEVITTAFGRSLLGALQGTVFTNLNADLLDGFHVGSTNDVAWGYIPRVGTDGVTELGKHIDFHTVTTDTIDYGYRLTNNANNELTGSGKFIAPEFKTTDKFNINDKASIQYNTSDDCIEFVFNVA